MTRVIVITPVLNGWLCKVGCQQVVFTDKTDMLSSLDRYYTNPDQTEKEFITKAKNKTMDGPCDPQPLVNTDYAVIPCAAPVPAPATPGACR